MEMIWYGLGCFRLTERGYPSVVTEPFDAHEVGLSLPRVRADIVTSSSLIDDPKDKAWPGLRGVSRTIAAPGEYEIGGVFITGVPSPRGRKRGEGVGENLIYAINFNGVTVCHLGKLGRPPSQAEVEKLGRVDVLLVPVGIPGGLTDAMASETVSIVEPAIVVPMQYRLPGLTIERKPVAGFLKEMGVSHPTTLSSLKVSPGVESEETQILLLEQH
ncbi:MAG: MBL fold metallo-hydrolase [Anaerolineae bacterium]